MWRWAWRRIGASRGALALPLDRKLAMAFGAATPTFYFGTATPQRNLCPPELDSEPGMEPELEPVSKSASQPLWHIKPCI